MLDQFNAALLTPVWLAMHCLLRDSAAACAQVQVIHPGK